MRFFPAARSVPPLQGLSVAPDRRHVSDLAWFLTCVFCLAAGGGLGFLLAAARELPLLAP